MEGADDFANAPIAFRNVVRYVKDFKKSAELYGTVGFKLVREMGDMVILKNVEGLTLILHQWNDPRPTSYLDSSIGFTVKEDIQAARDYVEKMGFTLLRAPAAGDNGYFFIYGDYDGNPINLVGHHLAQKKVAH